MHGLRLSLLVTVLLGCNGAEVAREEVQPVPEEMSGGVQVEPLPEGQGTAEPTEPAEEPTAPTTEPIPDEVGAEEAQQVPSRATSVRVVSSTCGENVREAQGELAATVRRRGQSLRIAITDLSYYCQPAPRFTARIDGATVVIDILPPEPGRPVARCVCLHDATIVVDEVPASVTTVRLVEDGGRQGLSLPVPPS